MLKIAFVTYCSDEYYHSMGCAKLVASAKYFHPEIPMIVYGSAEIEDFHVRLGLLHPFVMNKAMEDHRLDAVIYMDADSVITGDLKDVFLCLENDAWIDIIGVRNNNDFDKAGMDNPITQHGVTIEKYLNAGFVATRNKKIIQQWMEENLKYGELAAFNEQTVLNNIARFAHTFILDKKEYPYHYGVSGAYGTETHWDSWKEMTVEEGRVMLNGKEVKVIHHAGGKKFDKLQYYMFSEEVRKRLIEICEPKPMG